LDTLRIPQRFINEAKAMSQLSHPDIVGLLDYREEPDVVVSYNGLCVRHTTG
jgi:hypothetical protein